MTLGKQRETDSQGWRYGEFSGVGLGKGESIGLRAWACWGGDVLGVKIGNRS